jgi:hypothetical protein
MLTLAQGVFPCLLGARVGACNNHTVAFRTVFELS